jgi:hypothetical protein
MVANVPPAIAPAAPYLAAAVGTAGILSPRFLKNLD